VRGTLLTLGLLAVAVPAWAGGGKPPPSGKALEELAERYLAAPYAERRKIVEQLDRDIAPLSEGSLPAIRAALLKIANRTGPRIGKSGTNWFWEEKKGGGDSKRGKYIVSGKPSSTLFIGLHGGGAGEGDAESAASAMGGGGWWWIYPEVLKKTEHGWTDAGTEEFVLELIEAAKRTGKVDPNRVYITGHSMGGYGTWTIGAHHADTFGGGAAYAGAPSPIWKSATEQVVVGVEEGILPSFFALPLHVYQSMDDKNVPPQANEFATAELAKWKERFPGGFEYRYDRTDGRGHAAPAEGYMPSLEWIAGHRRVARPKAFLWQPVLTWKRHMYWLHWGSPEHGALLEAKAVDGNAIEITTHEGSHDVTGLSVLLGPPLVDLSKEVVVRVDGKERFRGVVPRTLSTLLLTMPRNDPDLLFDARVDL
jgi:hypothetical protein